MDRFVVPPNDELSINTLYTQWCTDLRRHRDYELTAAVWFSALQIGLATAAGRLPDPLTNALRVDITAKIIWALLVTLIGLSGVLAVAYTKERTRQLASFMNNGLGLGATRPLPKSTFVSPYLMVMTNLIFLPVANLLFGGVVLAWPRCALCVTASLLFCLLLVAAVLGRYVMFHSNQGPII
jgi:hypothetical protein